MLERAQPERADPGQDLGECRVAGHVGAQHQRVDEEPDQVVEGLVGPPGHRGADRDVIPGAQLGQQHRQRGLDHHEQRHALLAGQRGQPLVRLGGHGQRGAVPAVAGRGGARTVRGQRQLGRRPGQRVPPPRRVLRQQAARVVGAAEEFALPERVVGVLDRQRRPARDPALPPCGVRRRHVPGEDPG